MWSNPQASRNVSDIYKKEYKNRRMDILITTGKEVSQWSVFLLLFYQGH